MVDADSSGYSAEILKDWKAVAEATALLELKGLSVVEDKHSKLANIESEMPGLFAEMRTDLEEHPFHREFILIGRRNSYNSGGVVTLSYYFDDHPDLRQKIRILENHGLVADITHTNVDRFAMSEELAGFLKSRS